MSLTMTGMKGKHEKQEKPERKSERVMGKVMGDWQYAQGKSKQSKRKAFEGKPDGKGRTFAQKIAIDKRTFIKGDRRHKYSVLCVDVPADYITYLMSQ